MDNPPKNLPQFDHGNVVYCDECHRELVGKGFQILTDEFWHEPHGKEDYCTDCAPDDTDGLSLISDSQGIDRIYGNVYRANGYHTYDGSL